MGARKTMVQALILIGAVVLAAWIVITHVRHWGDWVVFGVIVATFFGAAWGIYTPRFTTKKRTFVKTTKPPR
jgi:uncharacterized membrane protein